MYAVIGTGGKQYRVELNDVIEVEKLNAEAGASVQIAEVFAIGGGDSAQIGSPLVAGGLVAATVLEHKRGDKVIIFKKRRRKNYRRRNGHRQHLTVLRIDGISNAAGGSVTRTETVKVAKAAKAPKATKAAKASEADSAPEADKGAKPRAKATKTTKTGTTRKTATKRAAKD